MNSLFVITRDSIYYSGWSKNEATLHFAEYLENYRIYLYDFLHTSRLVYTEYSRFSNCISYSGAIWRILTISVTAGLCSASQMKMLT